jgi:hypothetical protein
MEQHWLKNHMEQNNYIFEIIFLFWEVIILFFNIMCEFLSYYS